MIQSNSRVRKSWAPLLAAVLVAAACEAPTRSNDYRINHPIKVSRETVSMTVKLPVADDGLRGIERLNFERFVGRYLASGHGPLRIEAAAGDQAEQTAAGQVRRLLLQEGVREREITLAPGGAGDGALMLSYVSAVATAPECEDWSSNATFNWSNRTHANFGCATQRNLGQMVSDPSDLEGAKPMTGADGERNAAIIGAYRTPAAKGGAKQATAKGATK